jgi:hypothetical protein
MFFEGILRQIVVLQYQDIAVHNAQSLRENLLRIQIVRHNGIITNYNHCHPPTKPIIRIAIPDGGYELIDYNNGGD